jgi:hypothetical protein
VDKLKKMICCQRTKKSNRRLQMADGVACSTVTLAFRQPLQLQVQYVVNSEAVWAKGPGVFSRAGYALAQGWAACKDVLLWILQIWWLPVLGALGVMAYRKWGKAFWAVPGRRPS